MSAAHEVDLHMGSSPHQDAELVLGRYDAAMLVAMGRGLPPAEELNVKANEAIREPIQVMVGRFTLRTVGCGAINVSPVAGVMLTALAALERGEELTGSDLNALGRAYPGLDDKAVRKAAGALLRVTDLDGEKVVYRGRQLGLVLSPDVVFMDEPKRDYPPQVLPRQGQQRTSSAATEASAETGPVTALHENTTPAVVEIAANQGVLPPATTNEEVGTILDCGLPSADLMNVPGVFEGYAAGLSAANVISVRGERYRLDGHQVAILGLLGRTRRYGAATLETMRAGGIVGSDAVLLTAVTKLAALLTYNGEPQIILARSSGGRQGFRLANDLVFADTLSRTEAGDSDPDANARLLGVLEQTLMKPQSQTAGTEMTVPLRRHRNERGLAAASSPAWAQHGSTVTDDWRHQAACRTEDPELFFPVGTSGPALLRIAEAKTVCRHCPVVTDCLTWALESGQDAGVWGGMSEDERRALKRREARVRTHSA